MTLRKKPKTPLAPRKVKGSQMSLHDPLPVGSKKKSELKNAFNPLTRHGGFERIKQRKIARPFNSDAPVHLVLMSGRAKREWSMRHRRNRSKIISMIYVYAERFKVRVYNTANSGNQLHLLVKAKERKQLADFLRVLAGRVAVTVTGARRRVRKIGKFWDYLTWSRLINWGQDFFNIREFIVDHERTTETDDLELVDLVPGLGREGWDPSQALGS